RDFHVTGVQTCALPISAVDRVIPVALRRWRRAPLQAWRSGEWRAMKTAIAASGADLAIDAQGLIKSALLTRYTAAPVHGLDRARSEERRAGNEAGWREM